MLGRLRRLLARKFMNSQHIIVLCSCPDEASAARIARALVTERLAACVNRIGAVRSTYSWAGDLQDDPEVLLLIKTLGSRYDAIEARIRELHGYEVPEIVALPLVGGSGQYLAWLARESGADPAAGEDAPGANR
jgi:periplasmic divalent cation tolerance protein